MEYTDTGVTDDGWRRGQVVALAKQLKLQARPERTWTHSGKTRTRTERHNREEARSSTAVVTILKPH